MNLCTICVIITFSIMLFNVLCNMLWNSRICQSIRCHSKPCDVMLISVAHASWVHHSCCRRNSGTAISAQRQTTALLLLWCLQVSLTLGLTCMCRCSEMHGFTYVNCCPKVYTLNIFSFAEHFHPHVNVVGARRFQHVFRNN